MQYIILDMEWNQAWPGSSAARQPLPSPMRGEIVQIGAVRMSEDQEIGDEFQVLIRPKYFKKMNSKVAKLTGIRDSVLREHGIPFAEAIEQFRAWCGEDITILTWGFDDIAVLRENLAVHGMEADWASRWYNAQLIFNAQTDGSSNQKALKTALEIMEIEPSRPAHDALGDAYHTALICARLKLAEGIAAYEQSLRDHENGFHGAELPGCLARSVHKGYENRTQLLGAMSGAENVCPVCGGPMRAWKWYAQPGRRYFTMASCPEDGEFYLRVRIVPTEDVQLRANRLVYEPSEELNAVYEKLASAPKRRRPRRRKRSAAKQTEA